MRHLSRYVYRAPWEPRARPVASGHQNIVGLGAASLMPVRGTIMLPSGGVGDEPACPAWGCSGTPGISPVVPSPSPTMPVDYPIPARYGPWGIVAYGNTNSVTQPPPSTGVSTVVTAPGSTPVSPAPAPTVAVPTSQTAPQLTQPGTTLSTTGASAGGWLPNTYFSVGQAIIDSAGHTQQITTAGTTGGPNPPSFNDNGGNTQDGNAIWTDMGVGGALANAGIGGWLGESTLISGLPNWGIVAAAGLAAVLMMSGGKRR